MKNIKCNALYNGFCYNGCMKSEIKKNEKSCFHNEIRILLGQGKKIQKKEEVYNQHMNLKHHVIKIYSNVWYVHTYVC